MKKYLYFLFLIALTACRNEDYSAENKPKDMSVYFVAQKYGFTVKKNEENNNTKISYFHYASNVKELETYLKDFRENSIKEKYSEIGTINPQSRKIAEIKLSEFLKDMPIRNSPYNIYSISKSDDDPPYSHSATFYFDNDFPGSNVSVTINYNSDLNGNVTGAEVITGSWGYSFGNTYSQTNSNISWQNGTIVFNATGQFTTSVGIGDFSLNGSNSVQYTGYFQLPFGGRQGGGHCTQMPLSPADISNNLQ